MFSLIALISILGLVIIFLKMDLFFETNIEEIFTLFFAFFFILLIFSFATICYDRDILIDYSKDSSVIVKQNEKDIEQEISKAKWNLYFGH